MLLRLLPQLFLVVVNGLKTLQNITFFVFYLCLSLHSKCWTKYILYSCNVSLVRFQACLKSSKSFSISLPFLFPMKKKNRCWRLLYTSTEEKCDHLDKYFWIIAYFKHCFVDVLFKKSVHDFFDHAHCQGLRMPIDIHGFHSYKTTLSLSLKDTCRIL